MAARLQHGKQAHTNRVLSESFMLGRRDGGEEGSEGQRERQPQPPSGELETDYDYAHKGTRWRGALASASVTGRNHHDHDRALPYSKMPPL